MSATHGENISLEYVTTDAATVGTMVIKDANMAVRTLKASERIVIDDLEANIASGTLVDVFVDVAGTGTLAANELIASFSSTATLLISDKEGISLPLGFVPSVLASYGTGAAKIVGSGRLFLTSVLTRPLWQARLNA